MVKPLKDRLLVEPLKETVLTKGGILVDEYNITAPQSLRVKVLAVGPDCELKVGDILLVSQFAPTEAREKPSDRTLIIPEDDVLAIIVKDEND